jgi:hypothetical protein
MGWGLNLFYISIEAGSQIETQKIIPDVLNIKNIFVFHPENH